MALSKIDTAGLATDAVDNTILDLASDFAGIHFGGTGSANQLDDYEEGTWTPTIGQGTIDVAYASYTKIGNVVHIRAYIYNFSNRSSTAGVNVGGLPFTSASNNRTGQGILGRYINSGGDAITAYIAESTSTVNFFTTNQSDAYDQVAHNELSSTSSNLFLTITYIA